MSYNEFYAPSAIFEKTPTNSSFTPINVAAVHFCKLAGKQSLSESQLHLVQDLGFKVTLVESSKRLVDFKAKKL